MAGDAVIRKGLPGDIGGLTELLRALFEIESDFVVDAAKQRRGLEMLLGADGQRRVMVAEVDGRVVGMCSGQLLISTAEGGLKAIVEDLVLAGDCRGRGIGRQLLQAVETWAMQQGAKRLDLLADRRNGPALQFYGRENWRRTELVCLQKKP
ncbi:MAG: GNAT family N-acetyltransferase [Negativicutes bacterium]|nr:GNAT family N-acetyltransferase [Negativicutes bacterium]